MWRRILYEGIADYRCYWRGTLGLIQPVALCSCRAAGVRIIDELTPADEDLESFCQDYVMPLLNDKYSGYSLQCVGDPAARGRSGLDKRTAFDVLAKFGLRLTLAPTNAFTPVKKQSIISLIASMGY